MASGYLACGGTAVQPGPSDAAANGKVDAAKPDAAPVDATVKPDAAPGVPSPDSLTCGKATCKLPGQYCCTSQTQEQNCIAKGEPCAQGVTQLCDDATDCAAGQKCCIGFGDSGMTPTVGCAASCGKVQGFDLPQLCAVDSECGGSVQCIAESCGAGEIRVCGGAPAALKSLVCP